MTELVAGTVLSVVHKAAYEATSFNPNSASVLFGGGRFDPTSEQPYGYLYAGESDEAAVAEALLRDVPADDRGCRFLPRKHWAGRQLSRVQVTSPVPLISIRSGGDLGAVGQDTWLTTCDSRDYPQTRAWAHWLRDACADAAGIVWLSKREPAAEVLVLFEDRSPDGLLVDAPGPLAGPCPFDADEGFDWLRAALAAYRVSIRRPNR